MTRVAKIERKVEYFPIIGEIKETNDEKYQIGGYLNYKNNLDFGKDRTLNGAFKRTIDDSFSRKTHQDLDYLWPYLWNHDYNLIPPGGIYDANEDKKGLYTWVQFNPDMQMGRELYSSFKRGMVAKQSMGYKAIQYEYVKEGGDTVRNLIEIAIVEGSAVVFPMNDLAQVDTVKRIGKRSYFVMPGKPAQKDFNENLLERNQNDWLDDLWNLWFALKQEIITAFQIGDQPVDDVRAALDQFSTAMLAYVQQGIDLGMVEALQPDDEDQSSPWDYMSNEELAREIKAGRMISAANHTTMTKAVQGIQGHCNSLNKMLQAAKPKSMGAVTPHDTKEVLTDDAVSTHLDGLLTSLNIANLSRQLK